MFKFGLKSLIGLLSALSLLFLSIPLVTAQMPGAIFTTNAACAANNANSHADRREAYLAGGPDRDGGPGLSDGKYFVRITEADGDVLLGTSVGTGNPTPVDVVNGSFTKCHQLWAILRTGSNPNLQGFDFASRPDNYKVWISQNNEFLPGASKTDTFRIDVPTNVTVGNFVGEAASFGFTAVGGLLGLVATGLMGYGVSRRFRR